MGVNAGLWRIIGVAVSLGLIAGGCAEQADFVQNEELEKARQVILQEEYVGNEIPILKLADAPDVQILVPPSQTDAYRIDERVGVEGNYYVFNVHTRHGTYMVRGLAPLVKYCYEAELIEMSLDSKHGQEIARGVAEYVAGSFKGAVDLIIHPVDSVHGIGRSIELKSQLAKKALSRELSRREGNVNRINRTVLPGSRFYDMQVLKVAYRLRADAYTLNPHMQGLLTTIARDEEIGRAFFSGITWVVPGGSAFTAGQLVAGWSEAGLNPGGGSHEVERFIMDFAPDELLARLREFYSSLLKLPVDSGGAVDNLLRNISYSPRQQAYMAYYLYEMRESAGIPDTVERLAAADSALAASENYLRIQLIHALHGAYSPVKALVPMATQIGVLNQAGQYIVIPPWDHTRDREGVRQLLIETRNFARRLGSGLPQVWFIAECDTNAIEVGRAAGIIVRSNAALDQSFRFTDLRRLSYRRITGDPFDASTGTIVPDEEVSRSRR